MSIDRAAGRQRVGQLGDDVLVALALVGAPHGS
jgi:hypothetical protein